MRAKHIIAAGLALLPATANAAETVTYSYDAKGRLTNVSHAGGASAGVNAAYTYDAADNRTNVTVSGAWLDDQAHPVIMTPLRGGTPVALPAS